MPDMACVKPGSRVHVFVTDNDDVALKGEADVIKATVPATNEVIITMKTSHSSVWEAVKSSEMVGDVSVMHFIGHSSVSGFEVLSSGSDGCSSTAMLESEQLALSFRELGEHVTGILQCVVFSSCSSDVIGLEVSKQGHVVIGTRCAVNNTVRNDVCVCGCCEW